MIAKLRLAWRSPVGRTRVATRLRPMRHRRFQVEREGIDAFARDRFDTAFARDCFDTTNCGRAVASASAAIQFGQTMTNVRVPVAYKRKPVGMAPEPAPRGSFAKPGATSHQVGDVY